VKRIEDLTRKEMAWALTQIAHWMNVDRGPQVIDTEVAVDGAYTVAVLSEILGDLGLKAHVKDNGKTPSWVVGWHINGRQYCVACRQEMLKPKEGSRVYPILKGDPDWGEGSVPVCAKCEKEIFTLFEFDRHKG
jgi:hypothetical protein